MARKSDHPHVAAAEKYARDVKAGRVVANEWVKLACKRHLKDQQSSKRKAYPYRFDKDRAERACKFMELFPHTKGKWAARREPFILAPWQCFFVACIFGWLHKETGARRFRRALLLVSRKNGKSDLAARIGLYMFASDGEYGSEVYSGATSEKQAWEVFRPARLMAMRSKAFQDFYGVQVNASNLHIEANGSRFEPIIGSPGDGASPSCAITDEYHEHKTDTLLDTMETGMGAREQPLSLIITTAGSNLAGPCYALQKDAEKILKGVYEDDSFFALIYTVDDPDKEWKLVRGLKKANPNMDVSVSRDFLQQRLKDARRNARKQSTFKTKHLNVWVGARDAYFNVERWRSNADPELQLEDFEGSRAMMGLDLASKVDIAALEIVIPTGDREYVRFGKYYLPEAAVEAEENEHYRGWVEDGWITVTDGEITDYNQIKDDILDICSRFQVEVVGYDPHQATMLVTELMEEGVPVIEVRPTVLNFSEPMKELDGLIRAGSMGHNGDPVMTWMISNTVAKEDAKDNVYPRKERNENKIDGVVAHLMALNRAMADEGEQVSVYEERGILEIEV